MNFCSECGSSEIRREIPADDNRERDVCSQCSTIHYQNPKIVAGALLTWRGHILIAKRDIEPRLGYWTLPAGFMENGETIGEGAARESYEEALAQSPDLALYGIFNLPYISQVYVMYRGTLLDGKFGVGVESQDAKLITPNDIPWDSLAFPIVKRTLERYLVDEPSGQFPIFEETLSPPNWRQEKRT